MNLYTIGFTQKTAAKFFGLLKENGIDLLLDIRLNNKSQLAGFTKGEDLCYFLEAICNCKYCHREDFAPTKEILDAYKKKQIDWDEYVLRYTGLMTSRDNYANFSKEYSKFSNVCLLCSEHTPEKCHRRILAELIASVSEEISIKHI